MSEGFDRAGLLVGEKMMGLRIKDLATEFGMTGQDLAIKLVHTGLFTSANKNTMLTDRGAQEVRAHLEWLDTKRSVWGVRLVRNIRSEPLALTFQMLFARRRSGVTYRQLVRAGESRTETMCVSCCRSRSPVWHFHVSGVGVGPLRDEPADRKVAALFDDEGSVLCAKCAPRSFPDLASHLRQISSSISAVEEREARTRDEAKEAVSRWGWDKVAPLSTSVNIDAPKRYAEEADTAPPSREFSVQPEVRSVNVEAPVFDGMCITIDDKLAAGLAFTPHRPDAKPIGDKFNILVNPALGPLSLIRIVGEEWGAFDSAGKSLDLDDARIPVLRNIAYGACDLLAEQSTAKGGGRCLDDGSPLPIKLIKPTHHIRVHVGIDLRAVAIEVIEGKKTFEAATTEAIFVRGHWVNQPCGEGRRDRKNIWRRPHHRGRGARPGRTYEMLQERTNGQAA